MIKRKTFSCRILPVLILVGLLLVTFAPAASAANGNAGGGNCVVPEEFREQVAEITAAFREKMAELRAALHELRGSGQTEDMREIHAERFVIMEEKREAMSQYIPDEFREEFLNKGFQRANRHGMGKGLPLDESF